MVFTIAARFVRRPDVSRTWQSLFKGISAKTAGKGKIFAGLSLLRKDEAQSFAVQDDPNEEQKEPKSGDNPGAFYRQNRPLQEHEHGPADHEAAEASPYRGVRTKEAAAPGKRRGCRLTAIGKNRGDQSRNKFSVTEGCKILPTPLRFLMRKIKGIEQGQDAQTEEKSREGAGSQTEADGQEPEAETQRMPHKAKRSDDRMLLRVAGVTLHPEEQNQRTARNRAPNPERTLIGKGRKQRDHENQIFDAKERQSPA